MVRHLSAALVLCGLGLANMHGWLDPDLLPPYDFAGYVTVVEDVRNQVLRHGETPDWNPKWFAGTMAFLAVRVGPGQHAIEMRLEPPLAVAVADRLTAVSWLALSLAVSGWSFVRIRRRLRGA